MNGTVASVAQSNYVTGAINGVVGFWQSSAGSLSNMLGIEVAWISFFLALILGFGMKEFFPSFGWMSMAVIIGVLFALLKFGVVR
jgi:hypothetical protein